MSLETQNLNGEGHTLTLPRNSGVTVRDAKPLRFCADFAIAVSSQTNFPSVPGCGQEPITTPETTNKQSK